MIVAMIHASTVAEIGAKLGRSCPSVYNRSSRLGLLTKRRWTHAEDLRLEFDWGAPVAALAAELHRSEESVHRRALKLGIAGIPSGGERISASVKRCGFKRDQLKRILKWAGVELHPVLPTGMRKKQRRQWVEKTDCDDAIAKWASSETVQRAAIRIGISWPTVVRRLERGGLNVEKYRCGCTIRIPSDVLDGVAAKAA